MSANPGNARFAAPRVYAFFAMLGLLLLATVAPPARAQAVYDENRVKAAFLVRFAQFIDWPQETAHPATGTLVITVAGSDAVYAGLVELLPDRAGQARPIVARQFRSPEDLADTHIFFIGSNEQTKMEQYLASVGGRPILVVTDTPNALERGSMINFLTVDRRVRFEIGLDSAEKAGLTVSSRLLSIAMRIHRGALPLMPLAFVVGGLRP